MAKFNPTENGKLLIGKIEGQSIQITRNGHTIKTTKTPRQKPTSSQSFQRNQLNYISNNWQFLTPSEKNAWILTSKNYKYTKSNGVQKTRNGFHTFNFCNQNLTLIRENMLKSPKAYKPIIKPDLVQIPSPASKFIIQADNATPVQTYIVFATVHNSVGAESIQQRKKIIDLISSSDLHAGYDVAPAIKNKLPNVDFHVKVTLLVVAVDNENGNRDLEGVQVTSVFLFKGMNLDILSYYQFKNNGNDYFGINNATIDTIDYNSLGVVDMAGVFNGTIAKYMELGGPTSLNFETAGVVQEFSICFWFYPLEVRQNFWLGKRDPITTSGASSYQMVNVNAGFRNSAWDGPITAQLQDASTTPITINGWNFASMAYKSDGNLESYLNNNLMPQSFKIGGYSLMEAQNQTMRLGRYKADPSWSPKGYMCELVFFNQYVSPEQFEQIRLANLARQTIIDIN